MFLHFSFTVCIFFFSSSSFPSFGFRLGSHSDWVCLCARCASTSPAYSGPRWHSTRSSCRPDVSQIRAHRIRTNRHSTKPFFLIWFVRAKKRTKLFDLQKSFSVASGSRAFRNLISSIRYKWLNLFSHVRGFEVCVARVRLVVDVVSRRQTHRFFSGWILLFSSFPSILFTVCLDYWTLLLRLD